MSADTQISSPPFAETWLAQHLKEAPESKVLKAISEALQGDSLDELKLLEELEAIAADEHKGANA